MRGRVPVNIRRGLALALLSAALPAQAAAEQEHPSYVVDPGHSKVFMCGWGYGPIATEGSLQVNGDRLHVRKVTRISATSDRVSFSHRITVREDAGGLYRAIYNRGAVPLVYRDRCAGGGATY